MIYTGFYIIPIILLSKFYKTIKLNLGIVIGIIIPDLTIFFNYFSLSTHSHGIFSHSIITITVIYITLLISNELISKENKKNIKIINGILIGMLIHMMFDIIFAADQIAFYWPLPISSIEPIYKIKLSSNQLYIVALLHFFTLRTYAYVILQELLIAKGIPSKSYNNINLITKFMSLQSIFMLMLLVMYILGISFYVEIINFCLLSSLTLIVYFTYSIKEITKEDIVIG